MLDQLRADLERAAQEIEARGHCQGGYMDSSGGICTMQALAFGAEVGLYYTNLWHRKSEPRLQTLEDAVQREIGHDVSICAWNNAYGRTGRDVAAMLRQAARSAARSTVTMRMQHKQAAYMQATYKVARAAPQRAFYLDENEFAWT